MGQVAPTNESRYAHERAMSHVKRTNKQPHKFHLTNQPWITSHPQMSHVTPTNELWFTSHARTSSCIDFFWRTSRGSRRTHEWAMSHVTATCHEHYHSRIQRLNTEPWVTSHPRTSNWYSSSLLKVCFAGLFCRSLLTYINLVWRASYESRHTHEQAANPEATSSVGLFRRSLLSQILTYANLVWRAGHVSHPRTSS